MAGGRGGFSWDDDLLSENLRRMADRSDGAIALATEFQASRAEAHARDTAPWTDRTTNARNGLGAEAEHEPRERHTIVIFHGVDYGFWLEVRWGGRYAVVMPTAQVIGRDLMAMIARNWGPAVEGRS